DSMLYLFERCCASPETRALALSLLESKRDGMRTSLIPSIDKWRIQRQQLLEIEPLVVTGAKAKRRAKAGGDKKAEHGKPNRTAATKVIKSMVKKNATSKQIQRELDRLGLMKKSAAYELIKNLSGC
ncbi:MAG TPA: hypothetical protein PK402_06575, partial [Tepidisphaeraceae bacterium]|nr:hypothetical protein [Tepidisphaeraceae bacterium]